MSKTIELPFSPEDVAAGRVTDTADIVVRLRRFNSVTMEDAAKEIERMREALRRITALDPKAPIGDPPDHNFFIDQAQHIARQALT